MMWKSSDGPVPLAQGDWSHAPPLPSLPPPPRKKKFPIFPSKAPFTEFLRLEKRCVGMIQNLGFILFFNNNPKNESARLKGTAVSKIVICRFSKYLVNQRT